MPVLQRFLTALLTFLIGYGLPSAAAACEMCAIPFNARRSESRQPMGSMITTPIATTLGQGHGVVGVMFDHQRYNAIPARDAHELHDDDRDVHGKNHEEAYVMSVGYGLLDHLDLFVSVPLVSRTSVQIDHHSHLGRGERAAGLGDMRVMSKYRLFDQGVTGTVLFGVKAPSGETSDTDQSGAKFESEQQPGSGSWDLTSGLAVSRALTKRISLASAFQYTYRGEGAQDRKLGDLYRYDLGASYALKPLGTHPNLSIVMELHNQFARRDHSRSSDEVLDSGGATILLSPGLSADLTESLSAYWAMPFPLYQNLGGEHEELKYELITGLAWHF